MAEAYEESEAYCWLTSAESDECLSRNHLQSSQALESPLSGDATATWGEKHALHSQSRQHMQATLCMRHTQLGVCIHTIKAEQCCLQADLVKLASFALRTSCTTLHKLKGNFDREMLQLYATNLQAHNNQTQQKKITVALAVTAHSPITDSRWYSN